jgi:isoquinoline 1-oxidoreductase beta subunit
MGKWTRRGFITAGIVAGGALVVGVAIRPGHRAPKLAKYVTKGDETLLTASVKIAPDNSITAIIPHSEMGQGVLTSLGQVVAEEMDVRWKDMKVEEAPAIDEYSSYMLAREFYLGDADIPKILMGTVDGTYMKLTQAMGLQITGGSTSVRATGVALQKAGAAARDLLLDAAAKQWDVPRKELHAKDSHIVHKKSNKTAPFSDFVVEAANHKPNPKPKLKSRKDYTIMGKAKQRVDIPAKVDGTAIFGIDADVPGLKIATVKASPVIGNKVARMDATEARKMPGVIDVLNLEDCVAVVADGYWQAKKALDMVEVEFEKSAWDELNQEDVYAQYRTDLDTGKFEKFHKSGSISKGREGSASVFEAEYQVPFLAHACMEPMNATVQIKDGKCDIWTGSQNPLQFRNTAAKILGLKKDDVTVHNQFMGGGFGRRSIDDNLAQAVKIAQKTNLPIKAIWSREEDMGQDHYRPASIARLSAALGDDKMPLTWENKFVHRHDPPEAPMIPYGISNQLMQFVDSETHMRFGPWRSVDHTQHGFFTESFVDELAHNAGMDGYEFRRKLLKDQPRYLKVLDAAAKLGNWGETMPAGHGKGIAIVFSFDTIVAEVIDVDVSSGEPVVTNVAVAADAGMAVNPDGFKAQMESGVSYGLTAALYGDISIENGAVQQSNFHDYQMVRMDNAPNIDVVIVESDADLGGAGEPGTPPITPAVTNAIFAATGTRIRTLPIMNHDFGSSS